MYRQTRLLGVLLLLQVVGMVWFGIRLFTNINWDKLMALNGKQVDNLPGQMEQQLAQAFLYLIYFLPPVILLLLAGLSFILLRRRGWLLASVAQALVLLACLFYYSDPRPWFAYPIIAYCILMILYLNSQGVRAVFHSRRMTPASREAEAAHGE